jgi:hypothetical protein
MNYPKVRHPEDHDGLRNMVKAQIEVCFARIVEAYKTCL